MFLRLDENRCVKAYNVLDGYEAIQKYDENNGWVWYDGEFSFMMGENRAGYEKAFYLNEDGTIRVEYEKIPPRQPTPEEVMQAKLDYIMMMAE